MKFSFTKPKRTELRRRLREGAIKNAERDIKLAEEWSVLDEEMWENLEKIDGERQGDKMSSN